MFEISQSSWSDLSATTAYDLLRHRPYLVRMDSAPVLHYRAPLGIWQGAPVHYSLAWGLALYTWQATVTNSDTKGFQAILVAAPDTPLQEFSAHHALLEAEGGTIIRESLRGVSSDANLDQLLEQSQVVHAFAARHLASQRAASKVTGKISTLDLGSQTA